LELHVDTSPPETTATVRELGSSVEVTFFATDSTSGVDRIQWEGPGTFWGTFSEAFVRALTDTEQVLEYAATDRAGNIEPRRRLVLPALTDTPCQRGRRGRPRGRGGRLAAPGGPSRSPRSGDLREPHSHRTGTAVRPGEVRDRAP